MATKFSVLAYSWSEANHTFSACRPMARTSFGIATPLSATIRHLTHLHFTLSCSKPSRYSTLRAAAANESPSKLHHSLEIIGGAVDTFLPAFKTLYLPYVPYPFIAWNRHVETIFAAFFRSLPDVRFRRECLRTSDDGAVALDWVSGDDSSLCSDTPILILLPGLTGGSEDTYVRHMLLRARSKGWRVVVFNSRGCGCSPVTTAQFYSASFLGDISEVVEHVGIRYPRANLYAVGWSLGANILVRYVGQESFSCPLAGAISLCNPFNLVIADEDFRKGFNIVYDKALANALCKIFKRHALLFEDIGGEFNIPLAANAKSVREFDEGLTRVSFGFKSVDDYYSNSCSSDSIKNVSIPLLCIQAENDPIAPSRGIPREDIQLMQVNENSSSSFQAKFRSKKLRISSAVSKPTIKVRALSLKDERIQDASNSSCLLPYYEGWIQNLFFVMNPSGTLFPGVIKDSRP